MKTTCSTRSQIWLVHHFRSLNLSNISSVSLFSNNYPNIDLETHTCKLQVDFGCVYAYLYVYLRCKDNTFYAYVGFLSYPADGFSVLCWVDQHFVFNQGIAEVIWKVRKHVYLQKLQESDINPFLYNHGFSPVHLIRTIKAFNVSTLSVQ